MRPGKKSSESATSIFHLLRPPHMNTLGNLYGGQLAFWIDEVASVTAKRHCQGKVITAAIDDLRFRAPATPKDVVLMAGRITWVGSTSMEVTVTSHAEEITGKRRLINTAYVIMVAVDDDGKPVVAPALELETDEERADFAAGAKRQELRKQLRELDRKTGGE